MIYSNYPFGVSTTSLPGNGMRSEPEEEGYCYTHKSELIANECIECLTEKVLLYYRKNDTESAEQLEVRIQQILNDFTGESSLQLGGEK